MSIRHLGDSVLAKLRSTLSILTLVGTVGISSGWNAAAAQTESATVLSGTVTDPTGAVIRRATVHLDGAPGSAGVDQLTNANGGFSFTVSPGTYTFTITFLGFTPFTSQPVSVRAGERLRLPIVMAVAGRPEEISVDSGSRAADAEEAGIQVIEGDQLKIFSDDNATMQQQLRALAGGFGGSQYLVDGFSQGRMPPKSSIRSIRINRNPYSAYYSEVGFGRVEISTKPGAEKLHGSLEFIGTDQPFNADNPYAPLQPPYYQFQTDGTINGPMGKKTAFFASENIQILANNAAVNAVDPAVPDSTVSEAVPAPQHTDTYSLRVDHQFTPNNFAYVRDEWSQTHTTNNGIVPLVLPDAAFASNTLTNTLQASDTQVLGAHAVNEVRFQYLRTRLRQDPNSTKPSVLVQGSFQNGGAPGQFLRDNQDHYELQDLFEFDRGSHSVRSGFRFRELRDASYANAYFNGQYIFSDINAYDLAQPSQFSKTTGQPSTVLYNDDIAVFAEDDWKTTKNLTLSYGLRVESESGIPDHFDPAPRLGFAYAVRRGKAPVPLLTLRGGFGLFYDRFPATNLLQAVRQNGVNQVAYVVQNPTYNPSGDPGGAVTPAQPTIYRVDPNLRSSYAEIGSLTASHVIAQRGTVSATMEFVHNAHNFLTRNSNAPLPGTYNPADLNSGERPLGDVGNVYQYSSMANGNTERFFVIGNIQLNSRLTAFGVFGAQKDMNETDGVDHFTANPYNVRADYGRTSVDRPLSFTGGLLWNLPKGFSLSPYLATHSGTVFDITTGTDLNGDTIYNDRPAFATDLSRASVVHTNFGSFDLDPVPGATIVPRNYGRGRAFLWVDLQAGKEFHLGPRPALKATGAGEKGAAVLERPWDLKFSVEAQNLTNHNNPGQPIGVLTSPYFGKSLSLANDFSPLTSSNRTILLQALFTF